MFWVFHCLVECHAFGALERFFLLGFILTSLVLQILKSHTYLRCIWFFFDAIGALAQCPNNWGAGSAFHPMKIHILYFKSEIPHLLLILKPTKQKSVLRRNSSYFMSPAHDSSNWGITAFRFHDRTTARLRIYVKLWVI